MPTFQELEELLKEHNGEFLVFDNERPRLVILDPQKYDNFGLADSSSGKILVTGGAGYIGSHVVLALQKLGSSVVVIDDLSTGSMESIGGKLVVGSLADTNLLKEIFSRNQIEVVLHFAGSIIVEESVLNPSKYFQNNVVNGLNLLNCMVQFGVKKLVYSSSAAVYGNPQTVPIREEHPCQPTNPYGETKLIFEKILNWYQQSHGIASVILRYFNAAGADPDGKLGENHPVETHLIPRILRVASRQEEVLKIFGTDYPTADGTAVRDYIHVADLADAHILALNKLEQEAGCFTYNVGTGVGHSVKEVVDAAMELTGKMVMIDPSPRRPGDPAVLVADADRIKHELGFRPKYSDLSTIIAHAWNWHCKLHNIEAKSPQVLEKG
ncbi:MAG: UDP-glucose 4-epimerase GalE [Candidatus Doudnabacteria bacterium]|nr:UDP-glucose 4-epimerase GalE [Candidatus Doudnabacteria bacterium]